MAQQNSSTEVAAWVAYWERQDAWTVREGAYLCLGWNPNETTVPDLGRYNQVRESIDRAVRVRAVPTIDQLAWPASSGEIMHDGVPAFRPREFGAWAVKRYPETFPCRWAEAAERPLETKERHTLYKIIAALLKGRSNFTAGTIARLTAENGHSVAERTIRDHLSQITELCGPGTPERHASSVGVSQLVENGQLPKK